MRQIVKGTIEKSRRFATKTKRDWSQMSDGAKTRRKMTVALSGAALLYSVELGMMLVERNKVKAEPVAVQTSTKGPAPQAELQETQKTEEQKEIPPQQPQWHMDVDSARLVTAEGVPVPGHAVLTIEAGDDHEKNKAVLRILQEKKVKVIWFVSGEMLDAPDGKSFVKMASSQGHVVGSLGYRPSQMQYAYQVGLLQAIQTDLEEANKRFIDVLGDFPMYYRNASGIRNDSVQAWIKETGIRSVGWSIDSWDWKTKQPEEIVQKILSSIHEGGTIQLHVLPHTVEVLPQMIDQIRGSGYELSVPSL